LLFKGLKYTWGLNRHSQEKWMEWEGAKENAKKCKDTQPEYELNEHFIRNRQGPQTTKPCHVFLQVLCITIKAIFACMVYA